MAMAAYKELNNTLLVSVAGGTVLVAEANSQAYNKWITKLELIGRRLKNIKFAIEKEDLILHILYNPLPRLYEICQELDPCFIC
jgi:hypothetical protein